MWTNHFDFIGCFVFIPFVVVNVFLFYLFVTGIFVVKSSISINSLAAFNLFIAFVTMCFIKSIQTHLYLSLIHISEPTRLGMISYAVFCLKKKKNRRK